MHDLVVELHVKLDIIPETSVVSFGLWLILLFIGEMNLRQSLQNVRRLILNSSGDSVNICDSIKMLLDR
jgi:hypothetical protein